MRRVAAIVAQLLVVLETDFGAHDATNFPSCYEHNASTSESVQSHYCLTAFVRCFTIVAAHLQYAGSHESL